MVVLERRGKIILTSLTPGDGKKSCTSWDVSYNVNQWIGWWVIYIYIYIYIYINQICFINGKQVFLKENSGYQLLFHHPLLTKIQWFGLNNPRFYQRPWPRVWASKNRVPWSMPWSQATIFDGKRITNLCGWTFVDPPSKMCDIGPKIRLYAYINISYIYNIYISIYIYIHQWSRIII